MQTGQLTVLRPDAQELLSIRNGAWSYERIINYVQEMEAKLADIEKSPPFRRKRTKCPSTDSTTS